MTSDRTSDNSVSAGDESSGAGFSLVAVLVFMLIVSAVVTPFAVTAKVRLMIANNEVEQERLSLLAEGLGNVISSELTDGSGVERFSLGPMPMGCRSGEFSFDVHVQDHNGLIDLNAADAPLLSLGFASLGFDRQASDTLAKAAIEFRGSANAFSEEGAPQTSDGTSENKSAPFESVSELQEFSALHATPLHDLYAVFTVNSKRGTISLDRAPNRLRAILATGSGSGASVTQAPVDASAYTVEVAARRDGSGIAGQAGFIIEKMPAGAGFRRLSRSPVAEVIASPPSSRTIGCDALFGAEAAAILRGWSS